MTTGQRIAELRRKFSMSQPMLAQKMNVSVSTITSWENDRRGVKGDDLVRLAELFHVTTDYLLGTNNTPAWATVEDVVDLKEVLEGREQPRFNFGGDKLTDDQNSKLKLAITQIFWEKLRDQKGAGRDD